MKIIDGVDEDEDVDCFKGRGDPRDSVWVESCPLESISLTYQRFGFVSRPSDPHVRTRDEDPRCPRDASPLHHLHPSRREGASVSETARAKQGEISLNSLVSYQNKDSMG